MIIMKKTTLLILCLSFVTLYECSKEVDPLPPPVQAELPGEWIAAAYSIEGRTQSVGIEEVWFYDFRFYPIFPTVVCNW